jgi:hypothetical protein
LDQHLIKYFIHNSNNIYFTYITLRFDTTQYLCTPREKLLMLNYYPLPPEFPYPLFTYYIKHKKYNTGKSKLYKSFRKL